MMYPRFDNGTDANYAISSRPSSPRHRPTVRDRWANTRAVSAELGLQPPPLMSVPPPRPTVRDRWANTRAVSAELGLQPPPTTFDQYDDYFDEFYDEEGLDLASPSSACERAEAAYQSARQIYRQAVNSQQNAIRNRSAFGEELIQRLTGRVFQAERALLQAETARNNACGGGSISSSSMQRAPRSTRRTSSTSGSRPRNLRHSRSGRNSFDAFDEMFELDADEMDAATSRSSSRRKPSRGISNVDCNAMMRSCMENSRRRSGSTQGSSRCQACADSCRALNNLWPNSIPGTRMRCPR